MNQYSDKIYKSMCSCGNVIEVESESDHEPDYYTEIKVKCTCGEFVIFELPAHY